jgi:ParB family chromosome partitioning protein
MFSANVVSFGVIEDVPISEVRLPLNQLRSIQDFDELSQSIAQNGLLEPIIVRLIDNKPFYEIVAGCRRYLACKRIGRRRITCQITNINDKEAFEVSIIENVQRKSLPVMDEARAFKAYVLDYGWGGISELARKLGKSVSYVTKRIMLLSLPNEVKESIISSTLAPSIAEELFKIKSDRDKSRLAELIINKRLSTKNVRNLVREMEINSQRIADCTSIDQTDRKRKSFDKTILALRIAMNRVNSIIEGVEDDWIIREILMQHRRSLHDQIDILIKQKKKIF